jgi:D-alanyl-D-alanine dipeptidase
LGIKPYQQIPIAECGEPFAPISTQMFAVEFPHPYEMLSAPYGEASPYFLRQSVLKKLIEAQDRLQSTHPGWRIQIFDAYRPLAVQQFMVDYTFKQIVNAQGLDAAQLTQTQRQAILRQVYQFWAQPSSDPKTPPPHSTGAAVDITLIDADGIVVDMGSPIDEVSPRSHPDYYATGQDSSSEGDRPLFHSHRQLLYQTMIKSGFRRHPMEWWHFSWGDQLWAWWIRQEQPGSEQVARYGRVDLTALGLHSLSAVG